MNHVLDRFYAALALRDRQIDVTQFREAYEAFLRGENPSVLQGLRRREMIDEASRPALDRAVNRELAAATENILEGCGSREIIDLLHRDPHLQDIWLTQPEAAPAHGQYQLLELQGEGSLGKVWVARDTLLGRTVALKELKVQGMHVDSQQRFLREARITGGLQHPFIVPVYELHGGSSPYYTMRLVRGVTLAQAIARHHAADKDWPLDRLLVAFDDVCQAVAFAHASGIVHRDLKPANIVLGDFGEVFVLDWGLARETHATEPANVSPASAQEWDEAATRAGQIMVPRLT